METVPVRSAQTRRAEIQARAAAMGIDEAYISRLVREFYARIRKDGELGPIFEQVIGEDWEPHLARMERFWSSVALNSGRYSGKPVPVHRKLTQVRPQHFDTWLGLFRQTLADTAPTEAAAAYFMKRAEMIARSLRYAMFDTPGIPMLTP